MMTREQLVEAAEAKGAAMGWDAIAEDEGNIVTMLLSAEGASDQMVIAPLSRLRAELAAVGDPADYPAIEEYDLEADEFPEPPLVEQDGSWTEEAERLASPGELPAGPDGEDAPDIEPLEEAKENETMDLKELWVSFIGRNDLQDQGGIPDPIGRLGLHEDPEPAYHRPVSEKENKMAKTVVRTSSVFYVQGLKDGKPFSSDIYRFVEKAKNGARGAVAAGLEEVRVVRLSA